MQFKERIRFMSWYLTVLRETRKRRTGNFTTTVPFVWKAGDVFSVIHEILRSLPPEAGINGAEFSGLPKTHIPGYVVQDSRAVFLRVVSSTRAGTRTVFKHKRSAKQRYV